SSRAFLFIGGNSERAGRGNFDEESMSTATQEKIDAVQAGGEGWSAEEVVRWGLAEFSPQVALASSFGAEDVALIDIAARVRPDIRVFTLDTDFLFAETYELFENFGEKTKIQ